MNRANLEFHPAANTFPMLESAEFAKLVESVKTNGLQLPIVLFSGKILDGRNRYLACREAGVEPRFESPAIADPWKYAWSANIDRRQIEDKVRVAALYLVHNDARVAEERRKAAERASAAMSAAKIGKPSNNQSKPVATVPPVNSQEPVPTQRATPIPAPPSAPAADARKARTVLATEAGVSPRSMQKAMTLAEKSPRAFEAVAKGEESGNQAYRQVQRDEAVAKIVAEPAPMPTGPFHVIVADPPWAYEKRKDDGTHRTALSYPDMTTEEICSMPIKDLGRDDSILWLWTTNAFMRDAFLVLDAWGYHEKTILTWAKNRMGTGDWLRGQTEHCILAVRGKPIVTLSNQTTLLSGPLREHSRKPEEFYALVEALCPGSKVELFSRTQRSGWAAWGAEKEKF